MKRNHQFYPIIRTLFLSFIIVISLALTGVENADIPVRPEGPVDLYNAAGFPCVTAHSTTRALSSAYNGPLYQVKRKSDNKTLDIGIVQLSVNDPGGYADASAQDSFCESTICWITRIYDQSGNGNDLMQAPPGTFVGPAPGGFNELPIADMAPITIMGHKAYGAYIMPGMGFRNNNASGLPVNDEPQGIFMVLDGTHFDSGCCFNYGNTSTNSQAVGRGTMATVYFGTSTAWGRGSGPGPWIMSDMEAGLFSGYNTKLNEENPTIDSWKFVTGMVNGGGGNQWEIRGGDAQRGELSIFYKGIRPQSRENDNYFPMHRKGSIQLGNGGDNGNGSAGTFFEGVMTFGYPSDEVIAAVQQNIVAAGYDVPKVTLSRLKTFTPGDSQQIEVQFTNTSPFTLNDVSINMDVPKSWKAVVAGTPDLLKKIEGSIAPGETVITNFKVISPSTIAGGFLIGRVTWNNPETGQKLSEISSQMIRSVFPVKINEVRFSSSDNPTNQFIELYNDSDHEVDISNWSVMNTRSEWAPVKLGKIPSGTQLKPKGFYLLGLASSGLAAPAMKGTTTIHVVSTDGFGIGQQLDIDGEASTIKHVGTAATDMTTIFVPVSTGPWLTIPAGSDHIPVTNAAGFEVGQKMGIDLGGNYEEVLVTEVGKAATQTNLAEAAKAGDTSIKVWHTSNMTVGDMLTINTGKRKEQVTVANILQVVESPVRGRTPEWGEVELTKALQNDHMMAVDVSDPGTGIRFTPATRYPHISGASIQALGSGIVLEKALDRNHEVGVPLFNQRVTSGGYHDDISPDQWYGIPLSVHAGSIVLMDQSGKVVADAMIYGSQQSNSSANGTITSPEIAILEGDQGQGGCIAVIPGATARFFRIPSANQVNISLGRFPDGADTDNNCQDYKVQSTVHLALPVNAGSDNIKVTSTAGFEAGQQIFIDIRGNMEIATIKHVGSPGGTKTQNLVEKGATSIAVENAEGFMEDQMILIDRNGQQETAMVTSVSRVRRFFRNSNASDSIRIKKPIAFQLDAGTQISGSGITLTNAMTKSHDDKTQVADNSPTPGAPNRYYNR